MSNNFVNLYEGGLHRAGQQYDTNSGDNQTEARSFIDRMSASQAGLRGAAGTTFTGASQMAGGNLQRLAALIADQAYRATMGENTIQEGDQNANQAQNPAVSAFQSNESLLSRGINA